MYSLLSSWRDWRERRSVLRDVRRRAADSREREWFVVQDLLTYAKAALDRDDLRDAVELWDKAFEKSPKFAAQSPLGLPILLGLRRFDEAEALMLQGTQQHPHEETFARGLAQVAHQRGDYELANKRWAKLRKDFPGTIHGYVLGAEALIALDRLAEAQTLAEAAMGRFPSDLGGFMMFARLAVREKNWEQALERWNLYLERFDKIHGYVGAGEALIHLKRFDEADEFLQRARVRFPIEPVPLIELARSAEARGDEAEAIKRWEQVVARFPLYGAGYLEASKAFGRLGLAAQAEATLRDAAERFHGEKIFFLELARFLHTTCHNFPAAADAWNALRCAFPDNEESYLRGADALQQTGRIEEANALREEYRRRFPRDQLR